jgi:L-lactate dehydrogenase complex protein LldF
VSDNPLFPKLPYAMRPRGEAAVHDEQLQAFLRRATRTKDEGRRERMPATFGARVDEMRALAGRIKRHALDHLDFYLERFVENAEAAGARIHFAKDAEQANDVAVSIAKEVGAKLCVKSKSMVTEETRLLPALEAAGCTTVETDLGEFILQLDGDAPSHIVTPMIHKDRAAVARAFTRELDASYTEDPAELTRIARGHLRERYRKADLGICGANFLVAESGTVVVCTNEGNGRFCTSAPPTLIVFAGIEKLVPKEEHLGVLLKVLARSSTAQPLTCYTHLMTGPRRADEPDGPERMDIVLIDNGRTDVLRQPPNRELLACIRCGACLNACPVYRCVGGHSYGAVYSGPIGAVLTPQLKGPANYPDLPHASSLCGACLEACPVEIDLPHHLIRLRAEMVEHRVTGWRERLGMRLWARMLQWTWTYRLGAWMHRRLRRGWARSARGPLRAWTRERDLPPPAANSFRDWWRRNRAR